MPNVVSKLLVELDGRNDRLVAAIGGSEDALKQFRASAKQSGDALAALDKQIVTLGQGAASGKNAEAARTLTTLQRELKQAIDSGNLSLTERILLEQKLGTIEKALSASAPTKSGFGQVIGAIGLGAQQAGGPIADLTSRAQSLAGILGTGAGSVAVAGGIAATALLAIGVAAARSSAEIEQSFRRISSALPQGEDLTPLRNTVRDLALQFGESRTEILKTAEANVVYAKSAQDAAERTRASVLAQKALGVDNEAVAGGIDLLSDSFGLQGRALTEGLAKLVAYSRGANGVQETVNALQKSVPALTKHQIDLDTALRAIVGRMEQTGENAKQAGKDFVGFANGGEDGARAIRELAASIPVAANATAELERRAAQASSGLGQTTSQIREHITQLFQRIGDQTVSPLQRQLEGLLGLLEELDGTTRRLAAPERISNVINQGLQFDRRPKLFEQQNRTGDDAQQRASHLAQNVLSVVNDIQKGVVNVGDLSAFELGRLLVTLTHTRDGLQVIDAFGRRVSIFTPEAQRNIDAVAAALQRQAEGLGEVAARQRDLVNKPPPPVPPSVEEQAAALSKAQGKVQEIGSALQGARLELAGFLDQGDPVAQLSDRFAKLAKTLADVRAKIPTGAALDEITAKLPSNQIAPVREKFTKQDLDVAALQQSLEIESKFVLAGARAKQALEAQGAAMQILGTAAQLAAREVDSLVDNLFKAGADVGDIAEAKRLREQFNAAKAASEELRKSLTTIDQLRLTPLERVKTLVGERTTKERELAGIQGNSLEAARSRAVVEGDIAQIDERIGKAQTENDERLRAMNENAGRFAVQLDAALSTAFGLSSALLGSDAVLTKMLGSTLQVSDGIKKAIDAVGKLQTGAGFSDIFSSGKSFLAALPGLGQAIGGAIGIGSTVAGLFAESPEEKALRVVLEKNVEALHELARTNGDLLRSSQALNTTSGVRGALDATLPTGDASGFANRVIQQAKTLSDLGRALAAAGLSMKDLRQTAEDLGITLSEKPTVAELKQLQQAIRDSDLHLFFDTFAGDLERLDANDKIHGITDPIDKLIERAELLAKKSPIFAEIFKGIDLTTVEGRVEAQRRLQQKWDELLADPEKFRAALDASWLSLAEFKAQMLSVNDALNEGAIAAQQFGEDLHNLQLKFKVNKTSFADQVPELEAGILTGPLGDTIRPFLEKAGGDWAQAFKDFVANALADGHITEAEQAAIDAFQAVADAMDGAADAAKNAAEQAKQEAEATRQATNARLDEQERIDDFLAGHPQGGAKVQEDAQSLAAKSPAFRDLVSSADFTTAEGLTRFAEGVKHILEQIKAGTFPIEKFGTLTRDEFIAACLGMGDAALQAALGIRNATQTLLDTVNSVEHEGHVLGLDPGTAATNEFNAAVGSSPSIKSFIGGFDPTTAEGRASIVSGLRTLWGHIKNNPNDSIDGQPGSAIIGTVEHLIDVFSGLAGSGGGGGGAGGGGGGSGGATEVHGVVQTATIGQADEMIGLLTTILSVDRQIETNTRNSALSSLGPTVAGAVASIRAAMAAGPPRVPALPPVPAVAAARILAAGAGARSTSGAPTVLAFSADFSGGIEVKSLDELAGVLTRRFLDALIQAIGQRELERLFNQGALRPTHG
jgi:hypothetical protein